MGKTTNYQSNRGDKLIGVEIEFFGANVYTLIEKLRNAGLNVASYQGYTHATMPQWKITYDSSVTSTGTGLGYGAELVSPPLTIEEMERQLEIACNVLNELGAKVDKSCGIHVHHEIDDLTVDNIKNVYEIYYKHSEHIDSIMPKTRRAEYQMTRGVYCQPVRRWEMEGIRNCTTIQQLQNMADERYRVINFTSYVKYGTVEFRQHSGSTDFEKIFNWIMVTRAIVDTAKRKKKIKLTMGETVNRTMAFNKEVGLFDTKQGYYMKDRKAELNKKYSVTA